MNNIDRVINYKNANSKWELHCGSDNRITGCIYIGNNYAKANDYYGGYQGNYLKRIAALFPDKKSIAHLYAGQADVTHLPGQKYDINPQSTDTIYADAREMSNYTMRLARILYNREEEIDEEVARRMEENESDDYQFYYKEVVAEIEDNLVDSMID